jgi:uncharacterized protein (DUF2062 family)
VRKHFRRYAPDPEAILAQPWCAPFRPWLGHPNLWHLNRRSVPGAVAIGMFCGMIPGPVQMLSALLVAIPFRKNIPVSVAVTWYTNPLTIVPLYVLAYGFGRLLVGADGGATPALAPETWNVAAIWQWMLSLGKPLAVGLVALAVALALVGYVATAFAWRLHVLVAWRRRKQRRMARI